jgi:prepilin-type N-terminal cleavage/methylation domain-containing protein
MSAGVGVSSRSGDGRRAVWCRCRAAGFSLIELMVVVVIIGVLAALAIPSLSLASYERDTFNDAGAIMQLFREARARAVGRGSATLVSISANPTAATPDRGTFELYEAVGANLVPLTTCKYPTNWNLAGMTPLDGVNLNGSIEQLANIAAQPNFYTSTPTKTAFNYGYVCYTPLGRSYVNTGATAASVTPTFTGELPMLNPIGIDVTHTNGATIRTVLIPPNGMARVFSHL